MLLEMARSVTASRAVDSCRELPTVCNYCVEPIEVSPAVGYWLQLIHPLRSSCRPWFLLHNLLFLLFKLSVSVHLLWHPSAHVLLRL